MPRSVLTGVLLVFATAAPAAAADWYVDNVIGDDRLDGSRPRRRDQLDGPLKTINRALRLAQKGDRIILADSGEPYRESISLNAGRHTGDGLRPFRIVGNGAVLDGSRPIPKRAWEPYHDHVFRYRPAWPGFHNVFLNDIPAKRRPDSIPRKRPPLLEPLQWDAKADWVYFRGEKGKLPYDYSITHTVLPVGITLYQVHDVVIDNLFVQGFRLDGVNVNDNVDGCLLQQLTLRGNGRSGVFVGGASRDVVVRSCLAGDNNTAQVLLRGVSRTLIDQCRLLKATAPEIVKEERAQVELIPLVEKKEKEKEK